MSERVFYVYVLFRPWDGSPFYIGKGKAHRWMDYRRPSTKHRNKYLRSVIEKARRLGVDIPIVKIRQNLSETEAFDTERAFIAALGRGNNGPLANATSGGEGASGSRHTVEARAKMRAAALGNKNALGSVRSEETRERLRNRQLPASHGVKISAARKGKPLSPEHREKLRLAKIGKSLSAEHRAKIGASHKGRSRPDRCNAPRDLLSGRWISSGNVD